MRSQSSLRAKRSNPEKQTGLPHRAFALLAMTIVFNVENAHANDLKAEQEVYGRFESICLSFLNDYNRALPVINATGKKIDNEKAANFIYPQTGNAWLMKGEFSKSILVLSNSGACTVSTPRGASGKAVEKIFLDNNETILVDTLKSGSQNENFYKLSFPDAFETNKSSGMVMITTSSLFSYSDSVTLNAIPEKFYKKEK